MVTTDRQSAFDRVLASIPFKGQVYLLYFFFLLSSCLSNQISWISKLK